jgi:hypothetical protein
MHVKLFQLFFGVYGISPLFIMYSAEEGGGDFGNFFNGNKGGLIKMYQKREWECGIIHWTEVTYT